MAHTYKDVPYHVYEKKAIEHGFTWDKREYGYHEPSDETIYGHLYAYVDSNDKLVISDWIKYFKSIGAKVTITDTHRVPYLNNGEYDGPDATQFDSVEEYMQAYEYWEQSNLPDTLRTIGTNKYVSSINHDRMFCVDSYGQELYMKLPNDMRIEKAGFDIDMKIGKDCDYITVIDAALVYEVRKYEARPFGEIRKYLKHEHRKNHHLGGYKNIHAHSDYYCDRDVYDDADRFDNVRNGVVKANVYRQMAHSHQFDTMLAS